MSFLPDGSGAPLEEMRDLAGRWPTPFYLYSHALAQADADELRAGILTNLPKAELFYSVKTNPLLPLLRGLLAAGWGMEAVGKDNLSAALAAGATGERILMNGAAWSRKELERALFQLGVRRLTVDSLAMAELLGSVLKSLPGSSCIDLAIRIHDGNSHFGFPAEKEILERAVREIPASAIRSLGLHIHSNPPGSARSLLDLTADFRQRCQRLKPAIQALGSKLSFLDLGGGIDSPYVYRPSPAELGRFHNPAEAHELRTAVSPDRFSLWEAGAEIGQVVLQELGQEWSNRRVLFEPGRAVCTRALSALIQVCAVKRNFYPDAQVVITNGNTALFGPLHRGIHPVETFRRGELSSFIYGNLPHAGDWLFQNLPMPELNAGDYLLIRHTGAYFLALEASFGHGLPMIINLENGEILRG